jgi:dTDP-4-dehydrorhamnose 3,5-epimerase
VPEGFAHGFQTLKENSEVFYQVSHVYTPESEGGVRWNDRAFGIEWPAMDNVIIKSRDRDYADFKV